MRLIDPLDGTGGAAGSACVSSPARSDRCRESERSVTAPPHTSGAPTADSFAPRATQHFGRPSKATRLQGKKPAESTRRSAARQAFQRIFRPGAGILPWSAVRLVRAPTLLAGRLGVFR